MAYNFFFFMSLEDVGQIAPSNHIRIEETVMLRLSSRRQSQKHLPQKLVTKPPHIPLHQSYLSAVTRRHGPAAHSPNLRYAVLLLVSEAQMP